MARILQENILDRISNIEYDVFMEHFGEKVRARRVDLKLSQTELAAGIGLSQAGVSRLESSEYGPSDFRLLTKIAKALNQPLSDYISEDPSIGLETFFAFCPNPTCKRNTVKVQSGIVNLFWTSWESYPVEQFGEINFCPHCGSDLIKDCSQCHRRFPQKESNYCIRCGAEICDRPTDEEWKELNQRLRPTPPPDEPPPPPQEGDIPF